MSESKSEKPTQQRVRKARQEGQFLSSRGVLTAVEFVVFVAVGGMILPAWSRSAEQQMRHLLISAFETDISLETYLSLLRSLFWHVLMPLLGLGAAIFGATLAVNLAMTQFGFSLNKVMPQFGKLNPMARLSGLPMQNLKALGEAFFLMAALALSIQSMYHDEARLFLRLPFQSIPITMSQIATSIDGLLWKSAYLFILFGSIDLAFEYRRHMSRLKMSKQEVREENKRNDGDPQIKVRIRRMRRELLRRQMMKQVPKATAIVVNPTHYAVAIRYEIETMASPMVVAKGRNWLALRIRQVALQNEVPIIENPPLARALYDASEVGSVISPEFYKAIAEILAYVYKLMDRKLPT